MSQSCPEAELRFGSKAPRLAFPCTHLLSTSATEGRMGHLSACCWTSTGRNAAEAQDGTSALSQPEGGWPREVMSIELSRRWQCNMCDRSERARSPCSCCHSQLGPEQPRVPPMGEQDVPPAVQTIPRPTFSPLSLSGFLSLRPLLFVSRPPSLPFKKMNHAPLSSSTPLGWVIIPPSSLSIPWSLGYLWPKYSQSHVVSRVSYRV